MTISMKEFCKIDLNNGEPVELYLIETKKVDGLGNIVDILIPEDFKPSWGGDRGFHKPKWDFELDDWVEGEVFDEAVLLEEAKVLKFKEMSNMCQSEILGYFSFIINNSKYLFSFDYEAQSNFIGTMVMFTNNSISSIEWTAHKDGEAIRILLGKEQFMSLANMAFIHKNSKIERLRNEIQVRINNCESIEELSLISFYN